MKGNWSIDLIPDLSGQVVIVTGANAGLGFKSSLEFARKGAEVIIACRSAEKGEAAVKRIKRELPDAQLEVIVLDLINIDSIKSFAKQFYSKHKKLNILMNNGGVVNLESLQRTPDGQEMHMATNHLGHFALTGLLSEALIRTEKSRVVTLSSIAYKSGTIDFSDFRWEKRPYSRTKAYGDSKLANLLFTSQLQAYFDRAGASTISVAAHPGITGTERQQSIGIGGVVTRWLASSVDKGCLPQLMAAADVHVRAKDFYGPKYVIWGMPKLQKLKPEIMNEDIAQRLWDYSEKLTGVKYP